MAERLGGAIAPTVEPVTYSAMSTCSLIVSSFRPTPAACYPPSMPKRWHVLLLLACAALLAGLLMSVVPSSEPFYQGRPLVRYHAHASLAKFADNARPAVPALLSNLQDPDTNLRTMTTNALLEIAPEVLTNAPAK